MSHKNSEFVLWSDLDLDELLGEYTDSGTEVSDLDSPANSSSCSDQDGPEITKQKLTSTNTNHSAKGDTLILIGVIWTVLKCK